mgnify:CR=1 FL=1
MKNHAKVYTAILGGIVAAGVATAFDWPQPEIMSDSFFSYFGQLRGDTTSASLIFEEPAEIRAADSGRILVILEEHDSANWFDSTLGNAVVVSHTDNMVTVYGNLDAEELSPELDTMTDVQSGSVLGKSGNSGWQNGQSCLEFQVADTKNRTAINPRVLMPRIGKELTLTVANLCAISKTGEVYDFATRRNLPAGTYLLYRERQGVSMPFKTIVFINGTVVETTSYDLLRQSDGRLCVSGKNLYPVEKVYPSQKLHLLGEINISRGHNTISAAVTDILGKEYTITYNIDAY